MTTSYIVITPRYIRRVAHYASACKIAARLERNAQSAHGAQAGADCFLVADRDGSLEFRGLIVGRSTIGRNFGCGDAIVTEARNFAALGAAGAYRGIARKDGEIVCTLTAMSH